MPQYKMGLKRGGQQQQQSYLVGKECCDGNRNSPSRTSHCQSRHAGKEWMGGGVVTSTIVMMTNSSHDYRCYVDLCIYIHTQTYINTYLHAHTHTHIMCHQ